MTECDALFKQILEDKPFDYSLNDRVFVASLQHFFKKHGYLSDKQVEALRQIASEAFYEDHDDRYDNGGDPFYFGDSL